MEIVIAVTFTMVWAFLAYSLASNRGVDTKFWVIMALVFGPFALPFIYLEKKSSQMKDKKGSMIA